MADFNPYTDPSVIDYLDDTCTYAANADGSGGTPTDGSQCKYWGGKLGVIAATTTSTLGTLVGPTYRTSLAGGKPALVNTSGTALSFGQPAALTTPINATSPTFTALAVFKPTTLGNRLGFVLTKSVAGTSQNIRLALGTFASSTDDLAGQVGEAGQPISLNQFAVTSIGSDMGTNRRGCTKTSINGFGGWGVNTVRPADTTTDIMIGGQNYANSGAKYVFNSFVGEIYAIFFFNKYLNPYEIKTSIDQIHAHYSQPLPDAACRHNIVYDCNSISTITYFTGNFNRLIGDHPIYNNGWGGKSGSNQIQWFEEDDAKLLAYLARNGLPTIFGSNEMTNDGAGGGTSETAFENQRRLLTQAGPYAWKRFASTAIDRSGGSFSRDWLMRANAMMRRDYSQFADALCDFAGTPLDTEDCWASNFLVGDSVHPREPYGMDYFRAKMADTLTSLMTPPTAPATTWGFSAAGAIGRDAAGGQTSGYIYLTPSMGTAVSAVATLASSNASDVLWSDDASWSGSGNSGTLTWDASGVGSWAGRRFRIKFGATSGARTINATVGGVVVASVVITPAYTGGIYALTYGTNTSTGNRANGRESPLFAIKLRTTNSTANGVNAGLASGVSGTITIGNSAGTVNIKDGSLSWDSSNSEVYFTITVPVGGSAPITFSPSTTIPGVTVPAIASYYYIDAPEDVVVVAPLATAPHTTTTAHTYMGTARVRVIDSGTVTVTPTDSLGGTFVPSTLTFGPNVTCLPFYLASGRTSGTHSITVANDAGLTNPSAVTYTDNAGPYAGPLGFTAINPTNFTVTSPAPTGGTGPFTYLFQYAVEAAGGVPSTWTNIAAASSSQSATMTGLTAYTRYFVRCTVTDSGSLTSTSPIYDFLTSNLTAGTTSVSGITSSQVTETTTGGVGGLGTLSYQPRTAPDVAGSAGTFSDYGSPGVSKTATVTGLSPGTSKWFQFATSDSHPLAPATAYDSPVKATTVSSYNATSVLAHGATLSGGGAVAGPVYAGTAATTQHPVLAGSAHQTATVDDGSTGLATTADYALLVNRLIYYIDQNFSGVDWERLPIFADILPEDLATIRGAYATYKKARASRATPFELHPNAHGANTTTYLRG